jgi:hypothetical protein
MKSTLRHKWLTLLVLGIFASVFIRPTYASVGEYQSCTTDTDCIIGEFLYDDNYVPIVDAECTLTSRYPNGTVFINSATLPPSADGWYSYTVGTSGQPLGLYRGQICCTSGTDYLCLDKGFTIDQNTAESVWNYNNRTISTFGNIVSDIWSYSDRSLSGFGTLVGDIWSHTTKTLSSSTLDNGGTLATTDTVNSIGTSLSVLSAQVSAVQTTVITIDSKVDSLQTSINSIQSDTTNILNKWSTYSVTDILNYVDSLETQLGNNTQTCADNTTFGHIQCLIDKWGTESASTIYTAANNAYTTATSLRSELNFNGKSTTAYDEIIAIKAYVDTIETSIGSTSDTSSAASIFGRIKQVKEAVDAIDNSTLDLNDLLAKWGDYSATDIYDKVKNLSSEVSSINTVNNVSSILSIGNTNATDIVYLKNQVLAMRALLNVNRTMLESLVNKPIIKTWLEEGSIIFKNLITNPSKFFSQDVPFVYYFPPEVKQNHIIKKSDSLEIKFDPAKSTYYATGNYTLKPNETIIVEAEVEDIWTIPQEKLDSLKNQADELFVPLKGTSYFAQGTTLHSDILASLDKITAIQKKSQLPEDKINAYGQTKIEMDSISRQMETLKNIVSSAGSIGTLSGFIGGVQTLGVWGIIVVLVAGFVFLALYIKSLNSPKRKQPPIITPPVTETITPNQPLAKASTPSIHKKSQKDYRKVALAAVFGLSFGVSTMVSYNLLKRQFHDATSDPTVLSAITTPTPFDSPEPVTETVIPEGIPELNDEIQTVEEIPTIIPTIIPTASPTATPLPKTTSTKKVIVTPSINSYVNLRSGPDRNTTFISKILSGQELVVVGEKYNELGEKWLNVTYDQFTGWILAELTQAVQSSTTPPSAKITIIVPAYDTVYLYSRPSFNASITSKITQSQSADILVETKRWAKVILSRVNIEGWVSQDFIQKDIP